MKKLALDNNTVTDAVKVLNKGGVIVYPTETAYALGADFLNPQAIKKVYQIKGRNYRKPFSIIVSSIKMAGEIVKFNKVSSELAKKFWPGALTLVLESKINNYKSIALRISSNKLATRLARKLGRPVIATSANIAGKKECYSIQEVLKQFKNKKYQPDLIIDAGKLPRRKVSTVVKITKEEVKILRKGEIKIS